LAFLCPTRLALLDAPSHHLRRTLVRRKTCFAALRALTRALCFPSGTHLLPFMRHGLHGHLLPHSS
jgi:hypothetical protein